MRPMHAAGRGKGAGRLSHNDRDDASSAKGTAARHDAGDRPGASGHRFGPDLACSECGIPWDVHQRQPKPCKTEVPVDAFARRPSGDLDASPDVPEAPSASEPSQGPAHDE
jgi:hypothetical protein